MDIHLGRFPDDHRRIEQWFRLTHNDHANFYPDVWVEPAPAGAPAHVRTDRTPASPQTASWPAHQDSLIYLWEHGAAQNEIEDAATGSRHIFRPEPSGLARLGARHSMWTAGGYFIEKSAPELPDAFAWEGVVQLLEESDGASPAWSHHLWNMYERV